MEKIRVSSLADMTAIEEEMAFEDRWDERTVYRRLCATKDLVPDRPAVSFQLKSDPGYMASTLTWSDLTDQVTRAANLFRSLGIGKDDVVAYMLPTTPETLVCLLGGMTAGIVHPVNPLLEVSQIAALLKESGAKVLVTLRSFPKADVAQKAAEAVSMSPGVETVIEVDLLPHVSGPLRFLIPFLRPKTPVSHGARVLQFYSALAGANGDALEFEEPGDNSYCAYFHTGGTTGSPKIVQHRHSGVLYNGWLATKLLLGPEDIVMCPLPLFHVFAAYPVWSGCMCSGAHMVLVTPQGFRGEGVFDNFWKLCERWKTTFTVVVPTAVAELLQRPVDADVSSLKMALCGSMSLPVETFRRFEKATGLAILEGYGLTEATCLVSVNPPAGEKRVGSIGFPLPYVDARIFRFGKDGEVISECEVGEVGEICVSSPGVNPGETYTDPERNRNLFGHGRYLRTGDLGRRDADGYLWITGREKDQIIRGGHNIDPETIEEVLAAHHDVAVAGAVGQPDERAGELPCAFVELMQGAEVSAEELVQFARDNISEKAAAPVHIEILETLPKTIVGKVFKPDLREAAIARVYGDALASSGLSVRVDEVVDDRTRGFVVIIAGAEGVSDQAIDDVLGAFPRPWDRSQPQS